MLVRRCAFLVLEPGTQWQLDVRQLLSGERAIEAVPGWVARAPHLLQPAVVSLAEVALLGRLPDDLWLDAERLVDAEQRPVLEALIDKRLVMAAADAASTTAVADSAVRAQAWFGWSAHLHAASRWQGVDSVRDDPRSAAGLTLDQLSERYGPIPTHFPQRPASDPRVALPAVAPTPLSALLAARATCRNYRAVSVPLQDLAQVLGMVFGAHGVQPLSADCHAVKKSVPSGGALHPIEAYVLARRVDGLSSGLYHYEAGAHRLACCRALSESEADQLALTAVAGQAWFAAAPVLLILSARFYRNFWKYRNHPKAYRVLQLDAGHLSQTLFLAAGELGYGAFITAAINEIDLEQALGMDGMEDGPLAVLGFGARAERRETVEFDPAGRVWNADGTPRPAAEAANAGAQSPAHASMLAPHVDTI
ncbi:MAG: putative peptide maturation dehydrogenase [Lysobacterales bacterium]